VHTALVLFVPICSERTSADVWQ